MTKSAVILRRLLCVMAVVSALLALPNVASSQTGTTVTFPASSYVLTCQITLIGVQVKDVTSLTAYHLEIDFTPGDVQVTAVENGGFIPNGLPEPTNAYDNTAGTIVFGMARQDYNTQPVDGSGVLINLYVQAINPGAAVNFTIRPYVEGSEPTNGSGSMLVGWPDITPIPYTISNGTVYTQSCTATDILLSNNQINENLPVGSAIGTFTTIDPDGSGGFNYALWDTATYPDNAYFTISGNELRTNAIFNYETDSSYSIRVRSSSDFDLPIYRTFIITITDANDPPVLGAIGAQSVNELAPLTFTAAATDADTLPAPDTLTFSLANGTAGLVPAGASIGSSSGAFTWTPTEDQGPGAHTFDVCVSDGLASDCEPITVTVNEVNAAPDGADSTVSALEDIGRVFATADFGFSDANDNPANALLAVKITALPGVGLLTLDGTPVSAGESVPAADIAAGKLVFTPPANGNGTPYTSFTFQVQDNGGTAGGIDLDPEPKTMTINVDAVNDVPVATPQTPSVAEDASIPITLTGSDVEGSPLTYSIVTQPSHGTLSGSGATRTYTPAANYNGADSFTFKVYDGAAYSSPVTVSITVTPVNDAPVGVADHYYLNNVIFLDTDGDYVKDTYKLIANADPPGVLQNDSDVDGDMLSAAVKTNVTKGVLVLNSNGSFTYTLNKSLLQDAVSFVYTLSDGHGGSKDVTVNITIDVVGPAVVAQWLSPVTALAGSSNYYGMIYEASTPTVPLKVFVDGITDVAKVEFRWFDHTQTPDGVWYIVETDYTPTMENGKYVYTATLNTDSMPFVDDIQLWAYTYDVAGSYTRIVKVNGFDYYSRIMVNHPPSGYNVFLPFIRR